MVKHLSTMWGTQVQSLGQEDPLEKEMATHSSTLASHGRRSLVGYSFNGIAKSWTRLSDFTSLPLHPYMITGKTIALTGRPFAGKVMFLLFNTLTGIVIAFLPRSKRLLISWLQSPFAVILEPKKIKSVTLSLRWLETWLESSDILWPFIESLLHPMYCVWDS